MPKYSFYGWGSGLNRMGPNQQKMESEIMGHCWIHFPHDFLGNISHHHRLLVWQFIFHPTLGFDELFDALGKRFLQQIIPPHGGGGG